VLPDGYDSGLFLSPVLVPPGDPDALSRAAATYTAAHGEIERNRGALANTAGEATGLTWTGRGEVGFLTVAGELMTAYGLTAGALANGATALRTYSTALAAAQRTALQANGAVAEANASARQLLLAEDGAQQSQSQADDADQAATNAEASAAASPHSPTAAAAASDARSAANEALAAANAAAARLSVAIANYDADRSRALALSAQAVAEARQAADRAAAEFEAATIGLRRTIAKPAARPRPSDSHGGVLSDIGSFFGHAGHDLENWGDDAVNALASFGNAAIHDPGGVFSTLGGLALLMASGTGEAAGFVLDATGVGAIAGVPLDVVSAAGLATGAGLTGAGLASIARDAAGPDRVTVMQASGNPGGGAAAGGDANGGLGELVRVNAKDPAADALAERIGGEPSVRFSNGPPNEFDAVSNEYVAQAKPANFTLNQAFRNQAKATFETALQSGRTPYFQFDGPPGPGVLQTLSRYASRYGIEPVIDLTPLGGS
jgi:hypothetical protein